MPIFCRGKIKGEKGVLANGSVVRRRVYQVEVKIEDHTGKRRTCDAFCTMEERSDVALGLR
jgi:hypothetical protein